jgi:hypothetical protein
MSREGIKNNHYLQGGNTRPWILLLLLLVLISAVGSWLWQTQRKAQTCERHLKNLYRVFERYERQHGVLPALAFYPDRPQTDPDSLLHLVEQVGADPAWCRCPAVPRVVRGQGLCYVWNVRLNGQRFADLDQPRWMLVEITALSPDIGHPHLRHYNVLYTDGTVKRQLKPPTTLLPATEEWSEQHP